MHPMGNKNIIVNPARGKAVRIRHQMDTRKKIKRRLSRHIKSVVVCED
jgi:hypothetical protein